MTPAMLTNLDLDGEIDVIYWGFVNSHSLGAAIDAACELIARGIIVWK
jgi:hypothetical protein